MSQDRRATGAVACLETRICELGKGGGFVKFANGRDCVAARQSSESLQGGCASMAARSRASRDSAMSVVAVKVPPSQSCGHHQTIKHQTSKTPGEFHNAPTYAPALPKAARNAIAKTR